jgi:hypothetical protein
MTHSLFLGYFDVSVRSFRPMVIKPIDLERVRAILAAYCDKNADRTLAMADSAEEAAESEGGWLGRIGQEDVQVKDGYLICPWLSAGINQASVGFICTLQASLGMQIYEPGDARFFSPESLAEAERELSQSGTKKGIGKKKGVGAH